MLETLRLLDHRLFFWINNGWSHPLLDSVFEGLSSLGAWTIGLLALAFFAGAGGRAFWRHALVLAAVVMLASSANTALKNAINRARPHVVFAREMAGGGTVVHMLDVRIPRQFSFPSGHSMLAFFFMTYIALHRRRLAPCALLLAGSMAVARVYVGAHFPSDCLVGSLIGAGWGAVARGAYRLSERAGRGAHDGERPATP